MFRKRNGLDKAEKEFDEAVVENLEALEDLREHISKRRPVDEEIDKMLADLRSQKANGVMS